MSNVALTTRDGFANVAVTTRVETPVAPEITTTALPAGTVGAVYDQTIQVTGTAPITCTIQSGALPPELTLNETTRQITGPALATPGLYEFTVRATNSAGFDDQLLSILVPNEGSGGTAPVVTTVTLVPVTAEIEAGGETVDLVATVEDNNGDPIPNLTGTPGSNATGVATAAQLAPTDASGQATVRATSGAAGTANITITFDGVVSNAAVITVSPPPPDPITGSMAAQETGQDTFLAAGAAIVVGSMGAVETGSDVFAAVYVPSIVGDMVAVESGSDAFSATGEVVSYTQAGRTETLYVPLNGMVAGTTRKQPTDRLDIDLSFEDWLAVRVGDSIIAASSTVDKVGLDTSSPVVDSPFVKQWFAGGVDGEVYKISVTVATAQGRVKQVELKVRVKES